MTYDNISVTADELKAALRPHLTATQPVSFRGYYNFENMINEAVNAILRKRRIDQRAAKLAELPVTQNETVTVSELIAAFQRRGYADITSPLHVTSLVSDIKAHREPEWRNGDVVKDAKGGLWQRNANLDHPWSRFGEQAKYKHDTPVRPLRKVEV